MELHVDPKLFHEFHHRIAMALNLPATSREILEEFVDIDVNTEGVATIVQKNQYFEYMLLHEIRSLGLKENTPTLKAAIALLGMQRVRNFICALQIVRNIGRRHPEVDKDGKLTFKPSEVIPFAVKTEEYASNHNLQYGDTAYAAGLMYDLVVHVGRENYEASKNFDEFVGTVYKHGLRSARFGLELAKTFKNFTFSKYVFAGCLVHDIGKIAMELLFPTGSENAYPDFRAAIEKKPTSRGVRQFAEAQRFGLSHEYYSSQMAYYFQVLRPVEKAVLFHHEPYLLKNVNKELYHFACIIALASNMARNPRVPKGDTDPIYDAWLTPELKDFKIERKALHTLMLKVGGERT